MALDWDAIEDEFGGDYLPYAEPAKYTVAVEGVEFKAAGSKGNYVMKFHFAPTEKYQFPTADHWLVKDKQNWRAKHCKDLMIVLGCTEENAKKACEAAESKGFDYAVSAYEQGFNRWIEKNSPQVEIEVYPDGKYSRAEFTDRRVAMKRDDNPTAGAEEIVLDTELPF